MTNLTYLEDFSSFESMLASRAANKVQEDLDARHAEFMASDIQVAYSSAFDRALEMGYKSKACTRIAQEAANSVMT